MMTHNIELIALIAVLAPFIGSLIAGLPGKKISTNAAHFITILGVSIAFIASIILFKWVVLDNVPAFNGTIYTWAASGSFHFDIGFLIDHLTAAMMLIVTFVSLIVHVYSVGYMKGDPANSRFFSYVSLFTFAMLLLVTANNFLQLFIGWEGVGLVSYLLIGFWFDKEAAAHGSLKAFLINRVGDFGFILGLAAILDTFGTLSYSKIFAHAHDFAHATMTIIPGHPVSLISVICILLFIGAMGKSAQVPLHVWLPESMEGPTPISALIHAATMVTAGVFMVARMSPLFELSQAALSMVIVLGGTTALFLGLVAWVQHDIKRVIAYSTISQLGYMMAACGASAFSAGIFHLLMHACFKALLFLSAGSVIIAMHHEQDMRKMGGLRKYMPITYITFLIGALSLSAIPPFSGFFSKDSIIDAVHLSTVPGAGYAYICVLLGSFVTAFYIFRGFFLTFHGTEKTPANLRGKIKESPWVVTIPLIALAIPSVIAGAWMIKSILYTSNGFLGHSIFVAPQYNVLGIMSQHFSSAWGMFLHSFVTLPFWLAIAGVFFAWLFCVKCPAIPVVLAQRFNILYVILVDKFGFDRFNDWVFVRGGQRLARFLFRFADLKLIDDLMVGGSGRGMLCLSRVLRKFQSGLLYQYVLVMIIGLLVFLCWMLVGR
jgi:NADH-quinone oxidoreductase subunit L